MIEWIVASQRLFFDSNQTKEGRKIAYLNARLSFRYFRMGETAAHECNGFGYEGVIIIREMHRKIETA